MWVSDRHPDREKLLRQSSSATAPARGPVDDTIPLEAFARPGKRFGGRDGEMRVGLAQWEGRKYLALRLWEQDPQSGQWFPVPGKGCSIRLSEVARLRDALGELIEAEGLEHDRQVSRARGAGVRASGQDRGRPRDAAPTAQATSSGGAGRQRISKPELPVNCPEVEPAPDPFAMVAEGPQSSKTASQVLLAPSAGPADRPSARQRMAEKRSEPVLLPEVHRGQWAGFSEFD